MRFNVVSLISFTLLQQIASCARILGVFPAPSISHQAVYRAVTTELAKRGHELVIITPDPAFRNGKPLYNVTEIDVHDVSYPIIQEYISSLTDADNVHGPMMICLEKLVAAQLSVREVQSMINNEKANAFDLIIVEIIMIVSLKYVSKFNAPIIGISSIDVIDKVFREVGVPTNPIAYPTFVESEIKFKNVFDRFQALKRHLYNEYVTYNSMRAIDAFTESMVDKTPLADLFSRIDLLFINLNHIWAGSRPVPPNVIFTGSLHLQPQKALKGEINDILETNLSRGIIYISFGSNILSKNLPIQFLQLMATTFEKLPYTVLWKFEQDKIPIQLPPNVITKKWFPQSDMLGHPSIKAFVTQCGQQSVDEAIRGHVPLIGIPFFSDQHKNADRIEGFGIGIQLDFNSVTGDQLEESLLKIINDKSYKENITKLSNLMEDEPMSDIERAVWWSEYLIRNNGAKHFRGPATTIPYYQCFFLDVIALILLTMAGILYVIIKTVIFFKKKVYFVEAKFKTN